MRARCAEISEQQPCSKLLPRPVPAVAKAAAALLMRAAATLARSAGAAAALRSGPGQAEAGAGVGAEPAQQQQLQEQRHCLGWASARQARVQAVSEGALPGRLGSDVPVGLEGDGAGAGAHRQPRPH